MSEQQVIPKTFRESTDMEPFAYYDHLRETGPVQWDESMQAWLVTGYAACKAIEKEEERLYRHGYLGMETDVFIEVEGGPGNIVFLTGEEQRTLHRSFIKVLSPELADRWRGEFIEPIMADLIDRFVDRGSAELVEELCDKFPVRVITAVMGLPYDDEEWVDNVKWEMDEIAAFLQAHGTHDPEAVRRGLEASRRIDALLMPTIEARADGTSDDLIGRLWRELRVTHPDFTVEDMLTNVRVLVFGGSDTLAHVLANACHLLMTQPELQDQVRGADVKTLNTFVEECLRLFGAAHFRPRVANQDIEVAGTLIKKDDALLTVDLAANRDAEHYSCPHAVDLERSSPRDHLSFHFGPRTCVGSVLARAELQVAIKMILERLPNLRLDDEKEQPQFHGFMLRGYRPLHAEFGA